MSDDAGAAACLDKLARATREGRIAWTKQDEHVLAADLGERYTVKLELVEGFKDDRSPGPDHVVSLLYHGTDGAAVALTIDRRSVAAGALARLAQQSSLTMPFPYSFFVQLWELASESAGKATGHLRAANEILGRMLERRGGT
jgi:hypothetical protein